MPLIQGNTKDNETSLSLQAANNLFINSVGDEMSGNLNMNSNKITNLGDAVNKSDAVNKKYVDTLVMAQSAAQTSSLTSLRNNYDAIHYIHSQSIQENQLSIDDIKSSITSINKKCKPTEKFNKIRNN